MVMRCWHCGKMAEEASAKPTVTCPHCGAKLGYVPILPPPTPESKPETGLPQTSVPRAPTAAEKLGLKPSAELRRANALAGSWFLLLGATGCFVGCLFLLASVYEKLYLYSHTRGWVANFTRGVPPSGDLPIVAFLTPDDEMYTFTGTSGSYKVGQHVDVVYNPRNPNRASLTGFWDLWTGPVLLGTLSALCGLVWWGTRRTRK